MNSKTLLIVSVVIVVIVLVTSLFVNKAINKAGTDIKSNNNINSSTNSNNQSSVVTVNVNSSGFSPKDLSIKPGDQVVWINNSGKEVSVNSDVYPTNLLWKFLNLGSFQNGESVSTVFEKSGHYRYHNQLNPEQIGSVTVK